MNLPDMATGFPPMVRPDDVMEMAMEFKNTAGAIAQAEVVEDVI